MKTLSSLTATAADSAQNQPSATNEVHATEAQKGFWRRSRVSVRGIFLESSAGGQIFIPHSELWALAETHDTSLKMPSKTP